MNNIIIPEKIDTIVSSYGGVGTTFLLNFLSNYKNTNDSNDSDGLKHLKNPPTNLHRDIKFIYIYGNPILATISIFRRNYHFKQSLKLQKQTNKKINVIPREMCLEEYASEGIDKFLFEDHFYNWYDKAIYPTFFVKYEKLHNVIRPLFNFLEIPEKYLNCFPTSTTRQSSLKDISLKTQKELHKLYGRFNNDLKLLDDFEIKNM